MPKDTSTVSAVEKGPKGRNVFTIPHGPRLAPMPKQMPPPCTKYSPNMNAVRSHSSMASIGIGRPTVEPEARPPPGSYDVRLPQAKAPYISSLTRDKGSFLDRRSGAPNVSYVIEDKYVPRGGTISSHVSRFAPMPRSCSPGPGVYDFATTATRNNKGTVFSSSFFARQRPNIKFAVGGGGDGDNTRSAAFSRCGPADISFCSASRMTKIIDAVEDDLDLVEDRGVRSDMDFLKSVREDILRWKMKSALE